MSRRGGTSPRWSTERLRDLWASWDRARLPFENAATLGARFNLHPEAVREMGRRLGLCGKRSAPCPRLMARIEGRCSRCFTAPIHDTLHCAECAKIVVKVATKGIRAHQQAVKAGAPDKRYRRDPELKKRISRAIDALYSVDPLAIFSGDDIQLHRLQLVRRDNLAWTA